ncbi:MAG: MmcQ/YjbR family DNA-binding protein [Bryobacterales bacterium]|nr:MmcQ/YjbR family DNA-binding protein [Bryobacterales bacterium]MBV9397238.1 MmcQ/YjbR family DNA-binding protein [Bryobacterales bacterium]
MSGERAKPRVGPAPKLDNGIQIGRVRRICASIPGTIEKLSHGEPTFFTPKRVFAMFANNHHGDGHVALWVPAAPGVQAALIEETPDTYFKPPYVGPGGWVGIELSKVDDEQLGALIREAFGIITAKDDKSRRSSISRSSSQARARVRNA